MTTLLLVLPFVALTIVCWGVYGPVLHVGQDAMDHSSLRPFICVGLAYFVVAVVAPVLALRTRGEEGKWSIGGIFWSFFAGAVGALGALGIIVAFKFGGKPVYVMPLVFGCAPVVNTLVTMTMSRSFRQASPIFLIGIVLVALGAAGVLFFKPGPKSINIVDLTIRQFMIVILSVSFTALCWGAYGPFLHKGQMKMGGSRLRPLLCVGLAYFAIAVIVPCAVLAAWNEPGRFTISGSLWSLVAGAAGAIGALGIILAFNFHGRPIYVMPLVFGGAPVVNTLSTIAHTGNVQEIPLRFYLSLLLVIAGAVVVLVFSPRPGKPKKEAKASKPAKKEKTPSPPEDDAKTAKSAEPLATEKKPPQD